MPFTNAPTNDTYSQQRVSLVQDLDLAPSAIQIESTTGMWNVLPFKGESSQGKEEIIGETRDALNTVTVGSSGDICRGMYVWEKTIGTTYYFVVNTDGVNSKVYTSTTGLAASWTAVTTLPTNGTGVVRFTEFIDSTNTKKLVLVDGTDGYVFTSNAAGTRIVDADFPTPHVPFPVFMDGYLFLAKAGTGDIYNSDLNDPAVWTAGSFISSELYPDDIQALVKVNNYILAIGQYGSEYFYDAANATGSPLARIEGASLPFGTSFPNTIACNSSIVMLLANDRGGEANFKVIDGLKFGEIPAKTVMRVLNNGLQASSYTTTTFRGYFFRQNGCLFYGMCTKGASSALQQVPSVAYSFETKLWVRTMVGGGTGYQYPVFFTSMATSTKTSNWVAGAAGSFVFFGYTDSNAFTDSPSGTGVIQQTLVTKQITFGTLNRKWMHRVGLVYWGIGGETTANTPLVAWWPDYIQGSNSGRRTSPLSAAAGDVGFPFITQLGSFRYISFNIQYSTARARWMYLECDINKGQQ